MCNFDADVFNSSLCLLAVSGNSQKMLYKQSRLVASDMVHIYLSFFIQFEWFWCLCKACNFFYEAWQICNHLSNKRVLVFPLNCCVWCWCSRSGFWSCEWVLGFLLHSWSFFWLLLCSNSTAYLVLTCFMSSPSEW